MTLSQNTHDQKGENIDSSYKPKLIFKTSSGENIYRCKDSIVVKLPENRNSITTSWINGGYKENIEAIFNHQLKEPCEGNPDGLEGLNVQDYMIITAEKLGLNPEKTSGLITSADMEHAAISTKIFRNIEVTAVVTGGINVNGGRAGDPASYYEENGKFEFKLGTINTILIINSKLNESTLLKAMIVAVEAKTVALQQLMAPSKYSTGIATGSGTDGISVISNMESKNVLTNAGKHSKLGELIGKCVIEATTKALANQTNLTPDSQRDMLVRLNRFGIDEEKYWQTAESIPGTKQKKEFIENLHNFSKNPLIVAMVSSILHIVDEIEWGLIPETAGKKAAVSIMKTIPTILNEEFSITEELLDENDSIIEKWMMLSSWYICKMVNP